MELTRSWWKWPSRSSEATTEVKNVKDSSTEAYEDLFDNAPGNASWIGNYFNAVSYEYLIYMAVDIMALSALVIIFVTLIFEGFRRKLKVVHYNGQLESEPGRYKRLGLRASFTLEEEATFTKSIQLITLVLPLQTKLEGFGTALASGYAEKAKVIIFKRSRKDNFIRVAKETRIRFINAKGEIIGRSMINETVEVDVKRMIGSPAPAHGITHAFYAEAWLEVLPDPREPEKVLEPVRTAPGPPLTLRIPRQQATGRVGLFGNHFFSRKKTNPLLSDLENRAAELEAGASQALLNTPL